jgi:outer membrane lipoprotein SlyB
MHRFAVITPAVCLLLLNACASTTTNYLRSTETIAIQAKERPSNDVSAEAYRDSAAVGSDKGMKTGAATGAAVSVICGPAVFVCMPFFATTAAIIGSTAGGVAGATADAYDLYPPRLEERVQAVLDDITSRRDFFAEMRDAVREAVPTDRQARPEAADVSVFVGPERIELQRTKQGLMALRITASLSARWNDVVEPQKTETRQFLYATSGMPMEYWLKDNGAAFDRNFTECIRKLSEMMAWDLVPTRG